jgi:GNAT superfamily N-acetyltransferase
MDNSVEVTSKVGVKKDDIDYGSCHKWLTPISARAIIHPDESKPPIQVGKGLGFIIRRSVIQDNFYESMEVPHKGTMELALDLFDRYGRLKEEIHRHHLRKGSGVWNKELNDGDLVLIEDIMVEKQYRRKRIGSKLVLHIVEAAMRAQHKVAYAFAGAAAYYGEDGGAGNTGTTNESIRPKLTELCPFYAPCSSGESGSHHGLPWPATRTIHLGAWPATKTPIQRKRLRI